MILKSEVRGLGHAGDIKDVADGYAEHFLLPRGLATLATVGELKHLAQARNAAKAKKDREHEDAQSLAKRLGEITLVFKLKAGEQGKTFGSVTTKEIADALKREHRISIDPRKVQAEPLRALGVHRVEVRLLTDVRAHVAVAIEPA